MFLEGDKQCTQQKCVREGTWRSAYCCLRLRLCTRSCCCLAGELCSKSLHEELKQKLDEIKDPTIKDSNVTCCDRIGAALTRLNKNCCGWIKCKRWYQKRYNLQVADLVRMYLQEMDQLVRRPHRREI